MKESFTISVFTENHIGLLQRIAAIFTRRHINIESITASETEAHGIFRYTMVVNEERDVVKKVCKQIERQIEVFQAYYHLKEEVITQEIALYKLPVKSITNGTGLENIMRKHHARILREPRGSRGLECECVHLNQRVLIRWKEKSRYERRYQPAHQRTNQRDCCDQFYEPRR